jgi:hypothetical protein
MPIGTGKNRWDGADGMGWTYSLGQQSGFSRRISGKRESAFSTSQLCGRMGHTLDDRPGCQARPWRHRRLSHSTAFLCDSRYDCSVDNKNTFVMGVPPFINILLSLLYGGKRLAIARCINQCRIPHTSSDLVAFNLWRWAFRLVKLRMRIRVRRPAHRLLIGGG